MVRVSHPILGTQGNIGELDLLASLGLLAVEFLATKKFVVLITAMLGLFHSLIIYKT